MFQFESLVNDMKARIARMNPDSDDAKGLKIQLKAFELMHDELTSATRIALDLSQLAALGTGKDPEVPTLETVMAISGLYAQFLPLAYKQLVRDGQIPAPPVVTMPSGGDEQVS